MQYTLPSRFTVVSALQQVRRAAQELTTDERTIEVRLAFDLPDQWHLWEGDVSYDTHHSAHCADDAVCAIDSDEDLLHVADALLASLAASVEWVSE